MTLEEITSALKLAETPPVDAFCGLALPMPISSNPDRVQRDLDRYRDEMADDAPGSGTLKDNP